MEAVWKVLINTPANENFITTVWTEIFWTAAFDCIVTVSPV